MDAGVQYRAIERGGVRIRTPAPITPLCKPNAVVTSARGEAFAPAQSTTPSLMAGRCGVQKVLGDDLLSHADAHYHWRWRVSLPSSGWDRVGPRRYGRQALEK